MHPEDASYSVSSEAPGLELPGESEAPRPTNDYGRLMELRPAERLVQKIVLGNVGSMQHLLHHLTIGDGHPVGERKRPRLGQRTETLRRLGRRRGMNFAGLHKLADCTEPPVGTDELAPRPAKLLEEGDAVRRQII